MRSTRRGDTVPTCRVCGRPTTAADGICSRHPTIKPHPARLATDRRDNPRDALAADRRDEAEMERRLEARHAAREANQ